MRISVVSGSGAAGLAPRGTERGMTLKFRGSVIFNAKRRQRVSLRVNVDLCPKKYGPEM